MPAYSRALRIKLEDRLAKLEEFSNETDLNFIEWNDRKIGIITSGVAYQYAKEVFGDKASYLKLGFTYPLPMKKIEYFASQVETLYVIEELEPYLEEQIKAHGIKCIGKEKLPNIGELSTTIIAKNLLGIEKETIKPSKDKVVGRPPTLCAGCPHRGFFYELGKFKNVLMAGDIGCYGLGGSDPLKGKDTCICMGGSAGTAHGAKKAFERFNKDMKTVAIMGDSTFFHTGINGLIGILYNKSNVVTCILDNRTTGMTGHQDHPGTGYTLSGETTNEIDIETVVRALGCNYVKTINPHNLKEVRETLKWALELDEPSVIITRYPCALKKYSEQDLKEFGPLKDKYYVDKELCIGCKRCTGTGCPAIRFNKEEKKASIEEFQCVGCSVCAQVCPKNAIIKKEV